MSKENLVPSLLVTGAGMLVGGAVMAMMTQKSNSAITPEDENEAGAAKNIQGGQDDSEI